MATVAKGDSNLGAVTEGAGRGGAAGPASGSATGSPVGSARAEKTTGARSGSSADTGGKAADASGKGGDKRLPKRRAKNEKAMESGRTLEKQQKSGEQGDGTSKKKFSGLRIKKP